MSVESLMAGHDTCRHRPGDDRAPDCDDPPAAAPPGGPLIRRGDLKYPWAIIRTAADGTLMNHSPTDSAARFLTPRMLVLCAMVAAAACYRLVVHFVPGLLPYNFTPVEAMALFGGAYFSDRRLALAVPLLTMAAADTVIALSLPATQVADWLHMAPVIYLCIAATAFAGFALRGRVSALGVVLGAVGSATGFFLVTNFAVWASSGMYPLDAPGLAASYLAGLPFFQQGTLPGTLLWSALLFGGFALLSRRFPALTATPAAA
jgi:hypothetical protein